MENSITGLGTPAPATQTSAGRGLGLEKAGDVRSGIADRVEARADQRVEYMDARSVSMQDRFAELEQLVQATGYEHLGGAAEHRAEAAASRQESFAERMEMASAERESRIENRPENRAAAVESVGVRTETEIARAQELGETLAETWGSAAERMREAGNEETAIRFEQNAVAAQQSVDEHIASVETRSEELIAKLQSPPTAEGLGEAIELHAQEATARLDAFNTDFQDRMAAASEQAMEAGQEQIADRLSVRAEQMEGRIDTRMDNVLNRAAEVIDRIDSREMPLPDDGVDLHA